MVIKEIQSQQTFHNTRMDLVKAFSVIRVLCDSNLTEMVVLLVVVAVKEALVVECKEYFNYPSFTA